MEKSKLNYQKISNCLFEIPPLLNFLSTKNLFGRNDRLVRLGTIRKFVSIRNS